jgi:branched-chain amino acid transport system substrate-binding protein
MRGLALFVALVIASPCHSEGGSEPAPAQVPYKPASREPLDFRGPGRDDPEPEVGEVLVAWFGPGDPDHPELGDYWRGALVALDQENAAGGYRGKPFRLEAVWSESPWKAGIAELTRLVHARPVWAVLGGVDGTTTHLAVQVALKAHFLLLSPGSTDSTADHANVPWLFSLPPSDEAVARALAAALALPACEGPFAIAAATDHDSHATLVALRRALRQAGRAPAALVEIPTEDADVAAAVGQLLASGPRRMAVIAPPLLAARIVRSAREAGFTGRVIGGPGLSRRAFARAASKDAEGVLAPALAEPSLDTAFPPAYEERWDLAPDEAAAHGADAMRLVATAIRQAGLNRVRIRDAVRGLSPWTGASGRVIWSPRGRNERRTELGIWRRGRLVPLD